MKRQYFIGSVLVLLGLLWGISEMHIIDFEVFRRLLSPGALFFYLGLFLLSFGSNRVVAFGFIIWGGWQLFDMRDVLIDFFHMYIPASRKFAIPYVIFFLGLYVLSKKRKSQKIEGAKSESENVEKPSSADSDLGDSKLSDSQIIEEGIVVPEDADGQSGDENQKSEDGEAPEPVQKQDDNQQKDFVVNDKTALSSVNKVIASDVVFRGGAVSVLLGSYFLNLANTQFETGKVVTIDLTSILSGVRIRLPKNCEVSNQTNTFLAKNKDFRLNMSSAETGDGQEPKLQIKLVGFTFLGTIEIIE